ncbi:MAG TPA: hypothetical protein VKT73_13255 [Xanthobacteraceae bacterium]|nr:hypothetical protein [Xanthobacteraceae bacterium]
MLSSYTMRTRLIEWMLAILMIVWGVSVLFPQVTAPVLNTLFGGDLPLGAIVVSVGCIRIIALLINGHWRRSPLLRLLGSILGLMFWTAVGIAAGMHFFGIFPVAEIYPTSFFWIVFFLFEFFAAFNSAWDLFELGAIYGE